MLTAAPFAQRSRRLHRRFVRRSLPEARWCSSRSSTRTLRRRTWRNSGAELSARILACDGLWLASELALQEGGLLTGKGEPPLRVWGDPDVPGVEAFHEKRRHAYVRAENGALITHLRKCCDFIGEAIAGDGQVAVLSEEEGEAGLRFDWCLPHPREGDARRRRRRRRRRLATGVGYQGTQEFMKNLRFLERNGIPDWA